ncbi:MAG: (Fe-S)-binding protein [Anaerolineae bacterium]|nr:(Fe-S)-binding protein [Anaerolineae bacterium]
MQRKIQLFATCLIDTLRPETGEAVVNVLRRAGLVVTFPQGQTCCGQPAFNAGMRAEAREMARHTIATFEADPAPVVVPSGSCAAMLRHGYPELFADDPQWLPRAQVLAARTFEFTEFLVDELGIVDVGAYFPHKITYHASCHLLRGLGVDRQPRALLAALRGAELVELPAVEECCGFGGVFSVEHPEISAEMLKRKINNIKNTAASTIVVGDTGCLLHINGGLHRSGLPQRVVHIAEVLASVES